MLSPCWRSVTPSSGSFPVQWNFKNIEEDSEGGFLPSNDASGRGEGFVHFSVKLRSDLADNTELRNAAVIVFHGAKGSLSATWINTASYLDRLSPETQSRRMTAPCQCL